MDAQLSTARCPAFPEETIGGLGAGDGGDRPPELVKPLVHGLLLVAYAPSSRTLHLDEGTLARSPQAKEVWHPDLQAISLERAHLLAPGYAIAGQVSAVRDMGDEHVPEACSGHLQDRALYLALCGEWGSHAAFLGRLPQAAVRAMLSSRSRNAGGVAARCFLLSRWQAPVLIVRTFRMLQHAAKLTHGSERRGEAAAIVA
jgi:hypothetical protein